MPIRRAAPGITRGRLAATGAGVAGRARPATAGDRVAFIRRGAAADERRRSTRTSRRTPAALTAYLEPTPQAGRAFFTRGIDGAIVMLNLLRCRAIADYAATPELDPGSPITGEAAYRRYRAAYLGKDKEMGKLEFSRLRIEVLSPETAFVRGALPPRWSLVLI